MSMRRLEMTYRQCEGRGKHSMFLRGSGEDLKGSFGLVAIGGFAGICVQPRQGNRCRGIARGSGRILKRFAARAQNAECVLLFYVFSQRGPPSVEKATRLGVEETRDHRIRNRPRETVIA